MCTDRRLTIRTRQPAPPTCSPFLRTSMLPFPLSPIRMPTLIHPSWCQSKREQASANAAQTEATYAAHYGSAFQAAQAPAPQHVDTPALMQRLGMLQARPSANVHPVVGVLILAVAGAGKLRVAVWAPQLEAGRAQPGSDYQQCAGHAFWPRASNALRPRASRALRPRSNHALQPRAGHACRCGASGRVDLCAQKSGALVDPSAASHTLPHTTHSRESCCSRPQACAAAPQWV
eukprot:5761283-Prymnesium_polylepis.4